MVGNPANTNALIAAANAPKLDHRQFHAMTRLDHNRALSQLSEKTGAHVTEIRRMTIWGNHSSTQYPDIAHCTIARQAGDLGLVDQEWYRGTFIPTVQQRGAAIIKARGASSAASAASAAIDHMRTWALGTRRWRLGEHGACRPMAATASRKGSSTPIPAPARAATTRSSRVWTSTPSAAKSMTATEQELREERAAVE